MHCVISVWHNNGLGTSQDCVLMVWHHNGPKSKITGCRKEMNERGWLLFSYESQVLLFCALQYLLQPSETVPSQKSQDCGWSTRLCFIFICCHFHMQHGAPFALEYQNMGLISQVLQIAIVVLWWFQYTRWNSFSNVKSPPYWAKHLCYPSSPNWGHICRLFCSKFTVKRGICDMAIPSIILHNWESWRIG